MILSGRENMIYSNAIKKRTSMSPSKPSVSDIIERKIYPTLKKILYLIYFQKKQNCRNQIFLCQITYLRRVYFENSCLYGYLRYKMINVNMNEIPLCLNLFRI